MNYHISEHTGGAELQAFFFYQWILLKKFSVHYVCSTKNKIKSNTTSISDGVNIYWKKKLDIIY